MNTLTPTRQQIIEVIDNLPEDAFSELVSFIGYLRYKTVETNERKLPHNSFLLSIVGLGASTEKDILERSEHIAHQIRQQNELAAMAQDPHIQAEIAQIQEEFAVTELDGL